MYRFSIGTPSAVDVERNLVIKHVGRLLAGYEKKDEKREEYTVCDIRKCIYKLGDICGYYMILNSISRLVYDLFHHK